MNTETFEHIVCQSGAGRPASIRFFGRITEESAGRFSEAFDFLENIVRPSLIRVLINSEGGSVLHGMTVYAAIQNATVPTECVIEGMAAGLVPVIASSSLSAAGQFALLDESLFPVDDVDALARRIDWWIDHPAQLAKWGGTYAEHTKTNYSVESSVRKFVAMEREAIADNRR